MSQIPNAKCYHFEMKWHRILEINQMVKINTVAATVHDEVKHLFGTFDLRRRTYGSNTLPDFLSRLCCRRPFLALADKNSDLT